MNLDAVTSKRAKKVDSTFFSNTQIFVQFQMKLNILCCSGDIYRNAIKGNDPVKDEDKSRGQLIEEIAELKRHISDMKAQETQLLHRAQEALKKSEEKYRTAFEWTGTAMMVVDEDTMISMANHKAEEVTGYPAEEVNERRKWPEFIVEEDLPRMLEYHRKRRIDPDSVPKEYEFRMRHKSGQIRDIFINVSMIPGTQKSLISLIDITQRKRMEKALRESEERFRNIFSQSPIGIALFESNGQLMDMNAAFEAMFGIMEELKERTEIYNLFEVFGIPDKVKRSLKNEKGTDYEEYFDFEATQKKKMAFSKSGTRYLHWHLTPMGLGEEREPIILAQVQDITERKKAEEAQLEKAHKAAEKAKRLAAGLRKEIIQLSSYHDMISRHPEMKKIFNMLPEVAGSAATVLITGESGTGKELIARSLHELGPRKEKPFMAINCSALPDTLLESELFGYKAGAFTDAKKDKPGKLVLADGGTVFLDEIGDLSAAVQVKLLRVLQEKAFEPLGDTKTVAVDVRVITATNKDLSTLIKEDRFREDLYYRIKVLNINLPPLRARRSDIPILCDHFIEIFNNRYQKSIAGTSDEVMDTLLSHDFPGNIRELENIIEHAFIFCKGQRIEMEHLPPELGGEAEERDVTKAMSGVKNFKELEKLYIQSVLAETGGNKTLAAKRLGIHKATLFRKLKQLGIVER